jgi:regulator of protease activity HflC (stomatin/prohibitin superfamily)
MFSLTSYVLIFALVVAFSLIAASVRILREYERAVVFTLGRFQKVKGPGLVLLIPFVQEWCASICASRSSRYRART